MTRFGTAVRRIDERQPGVNLPLLSVSQTRGVLRQSELFDRPPRADSLDAYKVCRRDDIVFNKMSIRSGAMGIAAEDGLVTYHYEVMRPVSGMAPRYLVYLMKSATFTAELIKSERGIGAGGAAGVRTTEVPFSVLRNIDAYIPHPLEQRQIADYLDAQTAKIDALIGKQERLIETLAERRQAVISHAVTKGLDPNAPMKDSAVEWLGLVPRHWTVTKVKKAYDVTLGKMLDAARVGKPGDEVLPYIRAGNIQEAGLDLTDFNTMPFTPAEQVTLSLRASDLLVVEGGAVGMRALLETDMPGWSFQKTVNRVRARKVNSTAFLGYFIDAIRLGGVIDMLCNKSTIAHFTAEKLNAVELALPPAEEQEQVVEYLDRETSQIDTLAAKAREMIAVLKERRQALISAAVTGKIDVRGLA